MKNQKKKKLRLIRGDRIKERKVNWLFYPYLARGEVTILSADPGSGKTLMATWIAACVTRGLDFPVHKRLNTSGNNRVIYLSKEDQPDIVIVPRFLACQGDLNNFWLPHPDDIPESFADESLEDIFRKKPDLIIFDAVSSFFGDANMNQANEVRKTLAPLLKYARKFNTAILLIAHNNKMSSVTNAQYRVSGSVDFTAFARSGLTVNMVIDDAPGSDEYFVLSQFKNNLASIGESLKFSIIPGDPIGLEYAGVSDLSATDMIHIANNGDKSPKLSYAMRVLEEILDEHGGFILARELSEIIKEYDFSASTASRARQELEIVSQKMTDPVTKESYNVVFYKGTVIPEQLSFLSETEE